MPRFHKFCEITYSTYPLLVPLDITTHEYLYLCDTVAASPIQFSSQREDARRARESQPLTALFSATTVALIWLIFNSFQKEIAVLFNKPIPGVPKTFNGTKAGQRFPNPLGDIFDDWPHGHLLLAFDPLPLPSRYDSAVLSALFSTRSGDVELTTTTLSLVESSTAIRTTSETPEPTTDPSNIVPHGPGIDEYHLYTGNGSIAAGWPHKADWMSFSDMYILPQTLSTLPPSSTKIANSPPRNRFNTNIPLILLSCNQYHVTPNTLPEIASLRTAILTISSQTRTSARFILAIILQESNGCVRVPTSFYSLRNPGLMQSHNGPATCNEDASPIYPCPYATIEEMIREGTAGTFEGKGMGLVVALREADKSVGAGGEMDVGRWYRASRIYNSGSVDGSGDLGKGVATHCYASDVANRLRGWSLGGDGCVEGGEGVEEAMEEGGRVRVGLMGVGLRGREEERWVE
ncbi:MAG: hypothetical protein Q9169_007132 [Polycauliona sp. 2 TL-2023]